LLGALPAIHAPAQDPDPDPAQPGSGGETTLYVQNEIKVESFIKLVAHDTRKIFIYNPQELKDKTVFMLAQGARVPEAAHYNLLLAMLKQIGYGISSFGENSADNVEIYEIKKLDELGRQMHSMGSGTLGELKETASFVTMIVHLQYADPASVQRALLNLVTRPGGVIQPITGVNAVLISDFEFQIKRMARLLAILDQPGPQMEMQVLPVQYADATQIATTVGNLVRARLQAQARARQGGTGIEDQILIEADQRTNAIIVQALPENISVIRGLVRKLDIEIPNEVKGRIHIYFCKHADSTQLAEVLNSLISAEVFQQPDTVNPGQNPGGAEGGGAGGAGGGSRFRGPIDQEQYQPNVVADENTNALIITATPDDYLEIRKVIGELDIRKPQVMIEAAILEVNAEENLEFGVEIASIDQPKDGQTTFFGGTQFGLSEIVDADGVPVDTGGVPHGRSPNFSDGVLLALNRSDFFSIPILLKATQTQTNANVLSQPRVITNDNEEAKLTFTRGEPTVTTTTTQSTANSQGFGGYEDAGITFTITPHIASEAGGEYLRLEVNLKVETFATRSPNAPDEAPPPKNTREITGIVTIPNNSTIVIGGLTSTEATKVVKKIPLLADIPLIGELFKFQQTIQKQNNLYIFIRAFILRDDDFGDLRALSGKAIDRAEHDVKETLTLVHKDFFEQARKIPAEFKDGDIGRPRARHGFVGLNTDFEKRHREYVESAERRRMEAEARSATDDGSSTTVRVTSR
ncbi:MAG: secretin N-terminal domain-containing protein, partial [Planctomycetota bacterium]